MKNLYLVLAIIGFIAPNIFVFNESMASGNILLWLDPLATFEAMFSNRISTAFVVDLLVVVLIFCIWTYHDAKKSGIKGIWKIWVFTMLFGMACTFPYYLYLKEKKNG